MPSVITLQTNPIRSLTHSRFFFSPPLATFFKAFLITTVPDHRRKKKKICPRANHYTNFAHSSCIHSKSASMLKHLNIQSQFSVRCPAIQQKPFGLWCVSCTIPLDPNPSPSPSPNPNPNLSPRLNPSSRPKPKLSPNPSPSAKPKPSPNPNSSPNSNLNPSPHSCFNLTQQANATAFQISMQRLIW